MSELSYLTVETLSRRLTSPLYVNVLLDAEIRTKQMMVRPVINQT